jgi:hypothetical protein
MVKMPVGEKDGTKSEIAALENACKDLRILSRIYDNRVCTVVENYAIRLIGAYGYYPV